MEERSSAPPEELRQFLLPIGSVSLKRSIDALRSVLASAASSPLVLHRDKASAISRSLAEAPRHCPARKPMIVRPPDVTSQALSPELKTCETIVKGDSRRRVKSGSR
ncbi:hypothetical protein KM043_011533 [Ampulex compressa]|nr:hypothetical protein KM043_011533 [Ampulex compressa]